MLSADELRRFREADSDFFFEIHRRYTPYLRAHARSLVSSADDLDDVVQDTWIRVWHQRERFENRGAFRGWLWHVCRNVCIDWLRAQRRQRTFDALLRTADEIRPSGLSVAEAIRRGSCGQHVTDQIDDAIVALPGLQLQVAVLRWLGRHSTAQTADKLGIAPGTVKAALFQARRKLRERLRIRSPCDVSGEGE